MVAFSEAYEQYLAHFEETTAFQDKLCVWERQRLDLGLAQLCYTRGLRADAPDTLPERPNKPVWFDRKLAEQMQRAATHTFFHDSFIEDYQDREFRNMLGRGATKHNPNSGRALDGVGHSFLEYDAFAEHLRKGFSLRQPQTFAPPSARAPFPREVRRLTVFEYATPSGVRRPGYLCGTEASWSRDMHKVVFADGATPARAVVSARGARQMMFSHPTDARVLKSKRSGQFVEHDGHFFQIQCWFTHRQSGRFLRPEPAHVLSEDECSAASWQERAVVRWERLRALPEAQRVAAVARTWQPLRGWLVAAAKACGDYTAAYGAPDRQNVCAAINGRHAKQLYDLAAAPHVRQHPYRRAFLGKLLFEAGLSFVQLAERPKVTSGHKKRKKRRRGNEFCPKPELTGSRIGMNCGVPWAIPKTKRDGTLFAAKHNTAEDDMDDLAHEMEGFLESDDE